MRIRYLSLFSGIECASVAFRPLGWKPLAFSEVEPFACAVLAHHYPKIPNLGDMTAVDWSAYRGTVDVLIGGPPCVAFSVAGLRRSLEDARGGLSLDYARATHEIDPTYSITENVPGWLNTKDNAFGVYLARLVGASGELRPPDGSRRWPCAGLVAGPRRAAAWRVLDAQPGARAGKFASERGREASPILPRMTRECQRGLPAGLAQRRRRVFVVSVRAGDGLDPGAVLFERTGVPGDSAAGGQTRTDLARSLTSGSGGASGKEQQLTFVSGDGEPLNPLQGESPVAFTAKDHGGDAGALSPTLRAMPHDTSHMNGGGQVAVAHTLRAEGHDASEDGTGRGVPLAVCLAQGQGGAETGRDLGTTLTRNHEPPIVFHGRQDPDCHDRAHLVDTDGHSNAVAVSMRGREGGAAAEITPGAAPALRASNGGGDKQHVMTRLAVRRLTPRECEALQGLPRDYTLIAFGRGGSRKDIVEMAAYWGVSVEEAVRLAADSHRYRAIGNGMAVNVVRWIGQRIERVEKKARRRRRRDRA